MSTNIGHGRNYRFSGEHWPPNAELGEDYTRPKFVEMSGRDRRDLAERKVHPMSEWQDISTAPKDGSRVLVYAQLNPPEKWCEEVRDLEPIICGASYHPDAGFCVCEVREVTHWMPLPPPPSKGP